MNRTEHDMPCLDVQDARLRSEALSHELGEHVSGCALCTVRTDDASAAGPDLEQVEATLGAERGLLGRLRSLPTPWRSALGFGLVSLLPVLVLWRMPREDLAVYPVLRMLLATTALGVLLAVVVRLALRPLHEPDRGHGFVAAGLGGLLVPALLAGLPAAHAAHPRSLAGADLAGRSFACLGSGALVGALIIAVLWALDRGAHGSRRTAGLAAVAGGLAGNLALQAHCPLTASVHLLAGHAAVGLVLGALYLLALSREARE